MGNKKFNLGNYIAAVVFTFIFCGGVCALAIWLIKSDAIRIAAIAAGAIIPVCMFCYLSVRYLTRQSTEILFEKTRQETRPVLSYLGRVLSKKEESQPRAETIINSSMLLGVGQGQNIKMSLDTNSNRIIPFEETHQSTGTTHKDTTPIIIIRPFYFANYGKSIAVGLYVSLNGEKISFRSDAILEPNAKIQLEINDTIKFNKGVRDFTLTYADVYGYEYSVTLDGEIELADEESLQLEREVYFFYVEGFSEAA